MVNTNLNIIPFGGVRENGKNMFAVTVDDEIYILDCGLKYPQTNLLGIDFIIPDFNYLVDHADQVAGVFLTNGHSGSIGALPYLLKALRIPVFGTEFTLALAKHEISQYSDLSDFNDFNVIRSDSAVQFEKAKVSFFGETYSMPESVGIVIETKYGQIVYTGSFKFDNTVKRHYRTDYYRLTSIGHKKVLALLEDANGVESPGEPSNESEIDEYIFQIFKENFSKRIIASITASNIIRIQEIINSAYDNGRKISIYGKELEKNIKTAIFSKQLHLPEKYNRLFVNIKNIKSIPNNKLVILETGKSGEPIKELNRIANDEDRLIHLSKNDLVFISTNPDPAIESLIANTKNMIYRHGAVVSSIKEQENIEASSHASQRDFQFMLSFMSPEYLFPVSAEYRVFSVADYLAQEVGLKKDHIFLSMKGDKYNYDPKKENFKLEGSFEVDDTMIDGSNSKDVGNIVLRDRKMLSDDGVVIAAATIDKKKKKVVTSPKITTRGFIFVKMNRQIIKQASKVMVNQINLYMHKATKFDWNDLKSGVKTSLSKFFYEKTKRRPIVMPVVMEVNQNRRPNNNKKEQKNKRANQQKNGRTSYKRGREGTKFAPRAIRPKKETIKRINAQLSGKKNEG